MDEKNNSLLRQFTQIQWLLQRYQHKQRAQGFRGNPYRGQARIMKLLKLQPEISQKDLSELLDMRPQSLGELLAKLERKGYITRTQSENDRRVMNVQLTEDGRKATDQENQLKDDDELFGILSEEEQLQLSEWLGRIIGELEQRLSTEPVSEEREDGRDDPFRRTLARHGRMHGRDRSQRPAQRPFGGTRDDGERHGRMFCRSREGWSDDE